MGKLFFSNPPSNRAEKGCFGTIRWIEIGGQLISCAAVLQTEQELLGLIMLNEDIYQLSMV